MKKNINELTFSKKLQHIWHYYRTSALVIIIIILLAISLVKTISSNKVKYDAYCLILNDTNNTKLVERIKEGFPSYRNNEKSSIFVDYGYPFNYLDEYGINWPDESATVKFLSLEEDKADIAIADYNTMLWAVHKDFIYPLDEILPKDLLAQLEPYYEYAYFKVEDESDGKIYGLDISDTEVFKGYSNNYQNAVVFIPNLTTDSNQKLQHDASIEFINYLFGMK